MQIELIETYLDLMETQSFNQTAERLDLTQSTISNRVQTLEAALGTRLFTRSRAGTRPTPAGNRFLSHARSLKHDWSEARRAIGSSEEFKRTLRIGLQMDLAEHRIGDWVSDFRTTLPETSYYIEVDYSKQMCMDVLSGELDLAVVYTPRHLPDLHYDYVGDIVYRMVSTHAATVSDITPDRYIFANYSPAFDAAHRQVIPNLSSASVASGQNTTICELVTRLNGSAYVLERSARELIEQQKCVSVTDADVIQQSVHVAVHVRNRHAHSHRKILSAIKSQFDRISSGS